MIKRLVYASVALAVVFAAANPVRADFAVVRFGDGHCQIWWDSADNPWGSGWTKIALGLPDYDVASGVLHNAIAQRVCI